MRQLITKILGLGSTGALARRQTRRVCLAVEQLEHRLVLSGGVAPASSAILGGGIFRLPNAGDITSSLKYNHDVQVGLPMLDSKPDAPATLYLDFTGSQTTGFTFTDDSGNTIDPGTINTPMFRRKLSDTNPAAFTADEQALITNIWGRVAEDYAPFNINVSTHYYGSFTNGKALHVAIGGNNTDWLFEDASGISNIGSFTSSAPNVVFVFDLVEWANAGVRDGDGRVMDGGAATATTISHESGHSFGLFHHSVWNSDGSKTEYDPGTSTWTPIMGDSKASDRTTWYNGVTDQGKTVMQDDMAVIASAGNGFGYCADDHGSTRSDAAGLVQVPTTYGGSTHLTGKGIIEQTSDVDTFKFTTGTGMVHIRVDPSQYGPNLLPHVELWTSDRVFWVMANGNPTSQFIDLHLGAGTYYIAVSSYGYYGDVGQYTVNVDLVADPVNKTAAMTAPSSTGMQGVQVGLALTTTQPITTTTTMSAAGSGMGTQTTAPIPLLPTTTGKKVSATGNAVKKATNALDFVLAQDWGLSVGIG